jgi:hypothetical protein
MFLAGGSFIALLFLQTPEVFAVTKTYVGGDGGLWESAGSWSPSGVPTSADSVFVTSTARVTTTVSTGQIINFSTLTIGTSTLILNGDIGTGTNVTILSGGSLVQGNDHLQKISGDLTINGDSAVYSMTHTALASSSSTPAINFEATNITLGSGALINIDGRGYAGGGLSQNGSGPTPGLGAASGGSGGANCGNGGAGFGALAVVGGGSPALFASSFNYGSGGGGDSTFAGGAGGGKVKLYAHNNLSTAAGVVVRANGFSQSAVDVAGAGSGGSIWLLAKNYTGTGSFGAAGGVADGNSGAGGGGCLRLDYFTSSTSGEGSSNFVVSGGAAGHAVGTIGSARVYKGPAPVINFAAATGTPVNSGIQLSWTWGDGDFDYFNTIYRSLNGSSYSVVTTTPTTTLSFTDTGLTPATRYWYLVKTQSSTISGNLIFGPTSSLQVAELLSESLYASSTHIILPQLLGTPTFGTKTPTTLPVALSIGLNPSSTPLLVSDSNGNYYGASGALSGTSPNYITLDTWGGTFTGLSASTSYTFSFTPYVLIDGSYFAATSSLTFTTTTLLVTPSAPVFGQSGSSSIAMTWTATGNPTSTPYAVYNQTLARYHAADGSVTSTATYFPVASWNGSAQGLSPSTPYNFVIVVRKEDGSYQATSSVGGTYTNNVDNTVYSQGGVPAGATTSTGSGSGWYFGLTPPVSSGTVNPVNVTTTPIYYPTPSGSAVTTYYFPDGTPITPGSVFQLLNTGYNPFPSYNPTPVSLYQPQNLGSNIIFLNLPTTIAPLKVPTTLRFKYTYTNPSQKRMVKVERTLLSPLGKVLSRSIATASVTVGKVLSYNPAQYLSKTLKPGLYTMKVRVTSSNGKTFYDENSFDLELGK